MPLTVGELAGIIDLDDKGFTTGLDNAGRGMKSLQDATTKSTADLESTVAKSFAEISRAIDDGMDPQDAIRDLDRLEAALTRSMEEMLDEADQFAAELDDAIEEGFRRAEKEAEEGGKASGDALAEGLRHGTKEAERIARESGEQAGREFGDGAEDTGKGRMSGLGDTLMGGLKGLGWAAAGAAIGAALMEGLESALDAEAATHKLYAQLGATGPESEKLGGIAGDLYAQAYGESVGEVTDAIKTVVQATGGLGKANEETVKGITSDYLNLAEIIGEDVSRAIDAARVLVRNGMAKDFTAAGDVILGMYRKLGDGGEDALDTLREYSPLLKSTGLDAKTLAGIFVQAGGESRNFDVIADAMKEVQVQVREMTPAVKGALKDLGLSWKDIQERFAKGDVTALDDLMDKLREIEDPIKRDQLATALFAGTFENLGDALFKIDPSAATDALGKVDGSLKDAGDTLRDTAENKLTAFKRGLETNVVNFLGGEVLPAVEGFYDAFQAGTLDDRLGELGGKLSGFFSGIMGDIETWAAENGDLLSDLSTEYQETFDAIIEAVESGVELLQGIWDEWGEDFLTVATVTVGTLLSIIGGFIEAIGGIFKIAKGTLTGDWKTTWEGIQDLADGATKGIRGIIDKGMAALLKNWGIDWDSAKSIMGKKVDEIIDDIKNLPRNLKAIWDNAGTLLKEAGRALIQGLIDGIKAKVAELGGVLKDITDFIAEHKGPLDKDRQLLVPAGHALMDGLMAGMAGRLPAVQRDLERMMRKMQDDAVKVLGGNEMSGPYAAGDGEKQLGRLLGGAMFGLDVNAVAPPPPPEPIDPRPKDHRKPWGPNDATFDWDDPSGYVEPSSAGGNGNGGVTVNVDMRDSVIREDADIDRLANETGFKFLATP